MNKKTVIIRIAAILVLIAIAACMMVIGRGHTVYFDNKSMEVNGETFKSPYKVVVYVKDEQVAKLYDKERGMSTNIGQSFNMVMEITEEKGGDSYSVAVGLPLPYNMDGVIINIPSLLAGQPQSVYLSEFIATDPIPEEPEENVDDMGNVEMGEF